MIDTAQLFWSISVVLVALGIAWGSLLTEVRGLRGQITEIKDKLGNGRPSVFVRRDEKLAERIDRLEGQADQR